jgi:hypothetical protein
MLKTTDIDGKSLMVEQRAVCDNRRKVLPTVPKHVSDVHNAVDSVEEHVTNCGEKFVFQSDRTNRMTILGCESNQNQLDAAGTILMDGTFDYCPKFLPKFALSAVPRINITYFWSSACWRTRSRTSTVLCSRKSMRSHANQRMPISPHAKLF